MVQKRILLKPSAFAVLAALAQDALPGVAILERVRATTPGRSILGPGTLYRVLRELRQDGLVRRAADQPAQGIDDRQISYELTDEGRRRLEAEAQRLELTLALARRPRSLG
jgi:DNA-binding PadR family transcriptional regulator